jgi:hypothetical protein
MNNLVCLVRINFRCKIKFCQFGSTFGGAKIDFGAQVDFDIFGYSRIELILPQELILL